MGVRQLPLGRLLMILRWWAKGKKSAVLTLTDRGTHDIGPSGRPSGTFEEHLARKQLEQIQPHSLRGAISS